MAAVVVAACWAVTSAQATARDVRCPAFGAPGTGTGDTPASVAAAALRLVPREYRQLRSMGQPAWPMAQVLGAVSTARRLYAPQPPLRRLALRLCGAEAAEHSWAVFLQFPRCQIPCSEDTALIARTAAGWRIWYSEFHRP